jgi:hypothetical protein
MTDWFDIHQIPARAQERSPSFALSIGDQRMRKSENLNEEGKIVADLAVP